MEYLEDKRKLKKNSKMNQQQHLKETKTSKKLLGHIR